MSKAYNGDEWISHFKDQFSDHHFVWTHPNKSDISDIIIQFIKIIKIQWGLDIQILHYNNESILNNKYKKIIV